MNRRALLLALVMAIVGVFLLLLYQRRFELEASGGEKVKLLVAVKRLERGKAISDDMIATREVPIAYVDDRGIRESERSKILGLRVGNTVKEQNLVLWSDLATGSDEKKDLSSLVLPGYRAVSIRAARDETSITLIRPGDYVDVIGVLGPGGTGNEAKSSVVLLQRVLVLAIGSETSPDSLEEKKNMYQAENLLTLSLTLTEAQILALATERGKIAVAVRHPDDQQKSAVTDINFSSIVDQKERSQLRGVRQNGPPVNITAGNQPQ